MGRLCEWNVVALWLTLAFVITFTERVAAVQNPDRGGTELSTMRIAQQRLKADGYYAGQVDGVDGPMTQSAIRRYQRHSNLPVTGRLDQVTRDNLGVSALANVGEVNRSELNNDPSYIPPMPAVRAAQLKLKKEGVFKGPISGIYGPETAAAVRDFQRNHGFRVNGQLNEVTLNELGVGGSRPDSTH
jgi:peptidoglycan hydrolase-like protein with peptidoglycan-binding domain